jgi:hypothetical protein
MMSLARESSRGATEGESEIAVGERASKRAETQETPVSGDDGHVRK